MSKSRIKLELPAQADKLLLHTKLFSANTVSLSKHAIEHTPLEASTIKLTNFHESFLQFFYIHH